MTSFQKLIAAGLTGGVLSAIGTTYYITNIVNYSSTQNINVIQASECDAECLAEKEAKRLADYEAKRLADYEEGLRSLSPVLKDD